MNESRLDEVIEEIANEVLADRSKKVENEFTKETLDYLAKNAYKDKK